MIWELNARLLFWQFSEAEAEIEAKRAEVEALHEKQRLELQEAAAKIEAEKQAREKAEAAKSLMPSVGW